MAKTRMLLEGELFVVEYDDTMTHAVRIGNRLTLVRYNRKSRRPPALYYARLRADGVVEIVPGDVMRPVKGEKKPAPERVRVKVEPERVKVSERVRC